MAMMDGLEALGLGGMNADNLYGDKNKAAGPASLEKEEPKKTKLSATDERDLIFDKSYECPVCSKAFTAKTVRTGKVHTIRFDYDMRPVYDVLDQIKYEVVACPFCGYSVLLRYHGSVSDRQCKILRETIASKFHPQEWSKDLYTYDEAKLRYQLALANAVARNAKPSEKAFICLKTAWLLRGEQESLAASQAPEEQIRACRDAEIQHLGQALDGFEQARQTENFPIAGMDDKTLDYVMSALYFSQNRYQDCARFLGGILTSKNISKNLRTKAEDLKAMLVEEMKKNKPV